MLNLRRTLAYVIVIGSLAAVPGCWGHAGESGTQPAPLMRVLSAGKPVPVVIQLVPEGETAEGCEPPTLLGRGESVLAALPEGSFTVSRTYSAIPAIAGVLRSTAGAEALGAHPCVVGFDRDSGGRGNR
jgi:hypothetical protein